MKNFLKELYLVVIDSFYIAFLVFFTTLLGVFITFGSALTAAFNIAFKMHDRKRNIYIFKEYVTSFKKNFVQSTIIWILIFILGLGLFFLYNYANNTSNLILHVSVYIAAIELVLLVSYVLPIISTFETPGIFPTIKNALLMAHGHFFTSIKIMGTVVFIGYLVLNVGLGFLFIGIPIYLYFNTMFLYKIFEIYKLRLVGENNEVSEL